MLQTILRTTLIVLKTLTFLTYFFNNILRPYKITFVEKKFFNGFFKVFYSVDRIHDI